MRENEGRKLKIRRNYECSSRVGVEIALKIILILLRNDVKVRIYITVGEFYPHEVIGQGVNFRGRKLKKFKML